MRDKQNDGILIQFFVAAVVVLAIVYFCTRYLIIHKI